MMPTEYFNPSTTPSQNRVSERVVEIICKYDVIFTKRRCHVKGNLICKYDVIFTKRRCHLQEGLTPLFS